MESIDAGFYVDYNKNYIYKEAGRSGGKEVFIKEKQQGGNQI